MQSGFTYSRDILPAVIVVLEDINLQAVTEPVLEM
jgi:hypothetical protein